MVGRPPKIGEDGIEVVRRMAASVRGVLVPEIAEAFSVDYMTALRYAKRLVGMRIIHETTESRRRVEVFGNVCRGCKVYRAFATAAPRDWVKSRSRKKKIKIR